jgi:hypothetical protein
MPPATRIFIKSSFVYLIVALSMGLAMVTGPLLGDAAWLAGLWPVYWHLFMVGWVTQLIAGVAYWMFPKYSRSHPRGHEALAWATWILLNVGLILRALAEPALAQGWSLLPWSGWQGMLATSALLQWAGGMALVINTWPRVKVK